jgi:LEA14-like dessication related protein
MRFSALVIAATMIVVVAGCSSSQVPAGVTPPTVVVGTLEVPKMEATTMSRMSIIVKIGVRNEDEDPLTVERLEIVSVGLGPYQIYQAERTFNTELAPAEAKTFEVVATADAMTKDDRVGGQEGTVQVRVTGVFRNEAGSFKRISISSVGTTYAAND